MKDVNLAYDTLMSHYSIDRSYTADQEYTSTEPESIVICPRCETMNRLTSYSPDFVPVCGRCGFPLYDDGTTGQDYSYSYYDYWEDRTPCSDGTCIGIIGPDGRCGVCGKPYQPESTSTYHEAPPKEDVVPPLKNPMISAVKKGVGILVGLALLCIFSIYFSKDSEEDTTPPESPRFSGTSPQDVFDLVEKAVPESATTDYMTVTKESFKKYDMCKENIQAIQVCLSNIGYQPGPPDGILGERTLAALNEFCQDFRVRQQDDLAEGLFQPLMRHREVAEIHPDWQKLVNSDDLASWIAEQNIEDPVFLGRLLYLGTSRQIVTLLGFYKFDKERPPPLPLPITGIIRRVRMSLIVHMARTGAEWSG